MFWWRSRQQIRWAAWQLTKEDEYTEQMLPKNTTNLGTHGLLALVSRKLYDQTRCGTTCDFYSRIASSDHIGNWECSRSTIPGIAISRFYRFNYCRHAVYLSISWESCFPCSNHMRYRGDVCPHCHFASFLKILFLILLELGSQKHSLFTCRCKSLINLQF